MLVSLSEAEELYTIWCDLAVRFGGWSDSMLTPPNHIGFLPDRTNRVGYDYINVFVDD